MFIVLLIRKNEHKVNIIQMKIYQQAILTNDCILILSGLPITDLRKILDVIN